MNNEHEQNNEKKHHAKPDTFVIGREGEWFVANGYTHPDELIDHDGNLDEPAAFFGIFAAYNQHNIAGGTRWDTWPSWELCLTEMDIGLHFLMPRNRHARRLGAKRALACLSRDGSRPSVHFHGRLHHHDTGSARSYLRL